MNAFLSRLKQIERERNTHEAADIEPPKPPNVPFDPFGGRYPAHIDKKIDEVEIISAEPSEADKRSIRALAILDKCTSYRAIIDTVVGDDVILTVAIRGLGTCELSIAKEKFDSMKLLELIERLGSTTH